MSGLATCEILRREFEVHGDPRSSGWPICRARTFTTCARTGRSGRRGKDAPLSGGHRRAQGAGAERPAGLPAEGHGRRCSCSYSRCWASAPTNGSEYVNRVVVALLNKPHVGEFTKSRPRHSNDNARVEGKNAHVVRTRANCVGASSPFFRFTRCSATGRPCSASCASLAGRCRRGCSSRRGCRTRQLARRVRRPVRTARRRVWAHR